MEEAGLVSASPESLLCVQQGGSAEDRWVRLVVGIYGRGRSAWIWHRNDNMKELRETTCPRLWHVP